jgi:hypothetical protein
MRLKVVRIPVWEAGRMSDETNGCLFHSLKDD